MGATKSTETAALTALRAADAGVEMSFRIGQRVRHQDFAGKRVTGVINCMAVERDRGLLITVLLDAPIVIPADPEHGFAATNIHWQTAPSHEFSPFDDRDELIADLLSVAQRCEQRLTAAKWVTDGPRQALAPEAVLLLDLRAAIAKATGAAS